MSYSKEILLAGDLLDQGYLFSWLKASVQQLYGPNQVLIDRS
jgi:hypothetical protein